METLIAFLIVIAGAVILGLITQNKMTRKKFPNIKQSFNKKGFKQIVESTFPKYVIREKNGQIMICEYNHRNEANELIFIRINQRRKSIEKRGNMIIANYINEPSHAEMKKDFGRYL